MAWVWLNRFAAVFSPVLVLLWISRILGRNLPEEVREGLAEALCGTALQSSQTIVALWLQLNSTHRKDDPKTDCMLVLEADLPDPGSTASMCSASASRLPPTRTEDEAGHNLPTA